MCPTAWADRHLRPQEDGSSDGLDGPSIDGVVARADTALAMADRDHDQDTSDVVALAEHFLLIENAGPALAALVPEGEVVMANRAMRELLGYQGDDAAGSRIPELQDGSGCSVATWEDNAVERAVRLRRCDGSWLDARVSTVVVRGDGGRPEYLLCLVKAR